MKSAHPMNYLLDTNACIVFPNKRSGRLKQRLEVCLPQEVVLCSVVKAKLLYEVMKRRDTHV